ncbi:DUF4132 domain-containing protein [Actinomadura craniellae]|uniref:DUF4132 domain-containing protein n=1 Tax=Actinomadura craniellae TaxID=2231787 RepID=A0A365GY25_9ACTN|nr:DUF4132 domain-containing protein [Actinomadura craniellae]RAY11721.1 DUF4132 domain-containing protein [Actinomadura craniellae]
MSYVPDPRITPLEERWTAGLDPAVRDLLDRLEKAYAADPAAGQAVDALIAAAGDAELPAVAVWVQLRSHAWVQDGRANSALLSRLTSALADRRIGRRAGEVAVLWRLALDVLDGPYPDRALELLKLPLGATERLPADELPPLVDLLVRAREIAELEWQPRTAERRRRRIDRLIAAGGGGIHLLLTGHDGFVARLRETLATELQAPGLPELLAHWGTATASRPTAGWSRTAGELLAAAPTAPRTLRALLTALAEHREQPALVRAVHRRFGGGLRQVDWTEVVYLAEETETTVRGAVWTLERLDAGWVVPLLGEVAEAAATPVQGANVRSEIIANAAVAMLARRPEEAAVARLARLRARVKKKTILNAVGRALDAVGRRAGLTPEQLVERAVPDFGLGPGGRREERAGEFTAVLSIDAGGGAALAFAESGGRPRKTVPAAVKEGHPELLAELRGAVKELKRALPAERFRLEAALAGGRSWAAPDWRRYYLDHPVVGVFARALIWECSTDGATWTAGLPAPAGDLTDAAGETVPVGPAATVRLWHPIRATAGQVRAWRERLYELELRQPVKQAFREVYPLTPAERETATYSNRFAGHILRYGQAKALLHGRGWTGPQLGHWDGGGDGPARKEIVAPDGARWRAWFHLDLVVEYHRTAEHCSSDQIRFDRHDGTGWVDAPLAEVPPLVLSEALRDADLAVGVASIAADPEWRDRGEGRHLEYWHAAGFGELSEPARTRREALARLLPRTKLAGRAELTERFLRVRGSLRTYKIHLGSGNILMEPNDAYLCIVQAGRGSSSGVFLPFEDERLSLILSKAFLLADDASITDPSITAQLR